MMGSNLLSISKFTSGMNSAVDAQFNKMSDENILKVSEEIQYTPFTGVETQVLSDRTCGVYATLDITVRNNTKCYID